MRDDKFARTLRGAREPKSTKEMRIDRRRKALLLLNGVCTIYDSTARRFAHSKRIHLHFVNLFSFSFNRNHMNFGVRVCVFSSQQPEQLETQRRDVPHTHTHTHHLCATLFMSFASIFLLGRGSLSGDAEMNVFALRSCSSANAYIFLVDVHIHITVSSQRIEQLTESVNLNTHYDYTLHNSFSFPQAAVSPY